MICSNCHQPATDQFAVRFQHNYYAICEKCAKTFPEEPETTLGIKLYQKIDNKAIPYKLLTIHNIIKYWPSFGLTVLRIPALTEKDIKDLNQNEIKILAEQLREFAQHNPLINQNYPPYWKAWQEQGFACPYTYNGKIFTIFLSYGDGAWSFSVSSPYMHPLPDDFCKQIAEIFLPDGDYDMCKLSPDSPTTQFHEKEKPCQP